MCPCELARVKSLLTGLHVQRQLRWTSDTPAVGFCTTCGRGLCKPCTDAYEPLTCHSCFAKAHAAERVDLSRQYKKLILWSVALGLMRLWIGCSAVAYSRAPHPRGTIPPPPTPFFMPLILAWLFAGIPWGWNILSKVTSRFFLILPVIGWLLYFVYTVSASVMIGWIVMPFKLRKVIMHFRQPQEASVISS